MRNQADISSSTATGNRYQFHLHPAAQALPPTPSVAAVAAVAAATTTAVTTNAALATTATAATSNMNEQQPAAPEAHGKLKVVEDVDTSMQQQQQQQQPKALISNSNNTNKLLQSSVVAGTALLDNAANSGSNISNSNSSNNTSTTNVLLHRKQFTLTSDTSNASFSSASVAGSIQDDMSDQCSLTQAGLEEYNIRASSYYDQPVLYHHQKQSSYAQSEGYHSYVSSSDSSSATPFLDRLRQESEMLSRQSHHWSQNDLSSVSCASVAPSPIPLLAACNGRQENDPIVPQQQQQLLLNHNHNHVGHSSNNNSNNNNSSESTSSTETLKWLGSMSDVSEASHTTGYSAISESVSSSQLIVHSSRVLTPKRHHSESVLYLHDEQQQQHSPNATLQQQSPHQRSPVLDAALHEPSIPARPSGNHRHSPSYPPVHSALTLYPYQELAQTPLSAKRETSVPDLPKSSLAAAATTAVAQHASTPTTATTTSPHLQHKSSISVTIGSAEAPQPPALAANKATLLPGDAASGASVVLLAASTPAALSVVTNVAAATSSAATSPLSSSGSAASYRSNHRLFPVSTYTEPVHSNTSQFVHHPKPQYSTGLQKPAASAATQAASTSPGSAKVANAQLKSPATQNSPQSSWQSVAELINDFERSTDQQQLPQQYTYIEPSKTHRVSNPALKAFQKNAVQSYFERQQQQQQQQQHSKEHSQQQLYHHQQQQPQQLLRPHSYQTAGSAKEAVAQQLLRNSLPNAAYAPPHAACQKQPPNMSAMRSTPASVPQRPLPPLDDHLPHAYASTAKPPSPAPPPPPPRTRSLMPTLLRRSSSASDYADFRDQYMRASQEKLQAQSIKNISSAEKSSFNDCGMPPPPPPPRGRASLPARRTSSASEYAAMRDKVLLQQAAALAHQQHHPHQHQPPQPARTPHHYHYAAPPVTSSASALLSPSQPAVEGWVPERPPKNPSLRVPSPDLPPPPADIDTNLSDEPLPPPPPEILHRQVCYEGSAMSLHGDELLPAAASPNRRNSFAGSSTRRSFFNRSTSAANETSALLPKVPPLIPKKPTNIELLHVTQLPTSSKAQKVLLNGSLPQSAVPPTAKMAANRKRPHNPASLGNVPPILEHTAMSNHHIKTSPTQATTMKCSPPPPLMPRMNNCNSSQGPSVTTANNNKLRCNSKASYLPRQSLEKLNNSDPDHGSYKLTLTSNEDLVAHTKPSYDMLAHNGKLPNNLPDVLPLGAKLQPQPASPTSSNGSCLRYGSNNTLANANSPSQQQQANACYPPMYPPPQHHRYSTPAMSSYSKNSAANHVPSYARSQSFEVHASHASPTKFMSQSTIDLKRTHNLETTLEETAMPEVPQQVLSPAQSENNLHSGAGAALKPLSPSSARREFHRSDVSGKLCLEDARAGHESAEGRIFRAELVNTTLSTSPCGTSHKAVTRKDSLRENIEKITQLQSQLMSAHLSDSGSLLSGGFSASKPAQSVAASKFTSSEEHKPQPQTPSKTSDNDCSPQPQDTESADCGTIAEIVNDTDPPPPSLPTTPPPMQANSDDDSISASAAELLVVAQFSQMDSSMDGLKLMQRSELILRVNPSTTETASQTDELPDSDMGRLVVNLAKEEPKTRTTLQPRQRHPIELDCDTMSKELASLLSPQDKLIELLAPPTSRCVADYVGALYNPDVPLRPVKRDVGTSTLMRMKTREVQEAGAERSLATMELQYAEIEVAFTNGSDCGDSCDLLKQKVDELIRQLSRKIRILSNEQTTIGEESAINDELGRSLIDKLADKVRPIEATKCRTYIDDVGHITSLLLSLSERLARLENALSSLVDTSSDKKTMEAKRDRLLEQLDEAKRLKEDIDRRGGSVSAVLEKNLSVDEFADFDYFINMKAKLIADARDIADKIKCGEEQLCALSEALTQSDC